MGEGSGQGPRLYWAREREREYVEREAAGERLWTREVPGEVRNKVLYALQGACFGPNPEREAGQALSHARDRALWDIGWQTLANERAAVEDFCVALEQAPERLFATLIEALTWTLAVETDVAANPERFAEDVNEAFYQHRVGWELVNGRMIPFDSKELHVEVVEPVLQLLSHPGWDAVETAYQKALRELSDGHADDAITDVAAALQEALKLLGSEGSTLGQLANSGVSRGLLASYDKKLVDWIEADRSNRGDAHRGASGATRDDAWLAVHVAGALIRRLTDDTSRTR